jgi:hypothetical protein
VTKFCSKKNNLRKKIITFQEKKKLGGGGIEYFGIFATKKVFLVQSIPPGADKKSALLSLVLQESCR